MTTADKTKQKLLDSMRKSKSGAARKPAAGTRAKTTRKAAARRAPAKKAAAPKRPASAETFMPAITRQISEDPYQSHGRIWPD
jgi:hypothetical protein